VAWVPGMPDFRLFCGWPGRREPGGMGSVRHLTGTAGRWSAGHPWTVIAAWAGAVVILLVTGHLFGTFQLPNSEQSAGQSYQAQQMMSRNFAQHASEYVLFDSSSLRVSSPAYRAAIGDVVARIEATGRVTAVHSPLDAAYANQVSLSGRAALLEFQITGDVNDAAGRVAPVLAAVSAAAAGHPGIQIAETGDATITKALGDTVIRDLHRAEALSFPITLLVLLIAFGAVVAALLPLGLATAVVLNLLSVGAAYGVIVAPFQWGWGQSLLGFTSVHSITSWLPLFMFVVLFGLSMDYHVFILSRIRESYDRGGRTGYAVAHGIKTTAGVITAAAIVMVFVFLTFATLSLVQLKEMGVGLAVAVLLDATVVRALLLPATMTLLGPRNWYLPRWLEWLPRTATAYPEPGDHGSADDDARQGAGSRGRGLAARSS
jgi:putative drug exporter of the RND superfamily